MLPSERLIRDVVKDCASFGGGGLCLCFDHCNEHDPDVVFDKNAIFSALCSKCRFFMKPVYIQVLIKTLEARIKQIYGLKVEALFFILMCCTFRKYSEAMKF